MLPPNSTRTAPQSSLVFENNYEAAYALGVEKTRRNIALLAEQPKSAAFAEDGNYFTFKEGFFDIGNWTSSFFTGMALLAFESTGDLYFLQQTNRLSDVYREKITKQSRATMHDLGFLYSLYSVPLHRLTGCPIHRRTAIHAADTLAKRFVQRGRYIQAWGAMDDRNTEYAGLAIIDCLMNLPLLFWASRETGNRFYTSIAVAHLNTTLDFFVRPDDSVCHAYRFNVATGAPIGPDNYCGHTVDSHWARGTAWAIYGFALAHRHTSDTRYRDVALRLTRKFTALLGPERVPVWDFKIQSGPEAVHDSSAAAVAVCAFDELNSYEPDLGLGQAAEEILMKLCSPSYLDSDKNRPGLLRNAQIGDGVGKAKSAYTSWGDYFFMEALARRLHGINAPWR